MSKSDGNFVTIDELLNKNTVGGRAWHGDVIRMAMLMTHYREPIDFSLERLEAAENILLDWYAVTLPDDGIVDQVFLAALADDLNTSEAIARLHQLGSNVDDERNRQESLRRLGFTVDHAELLNYSNHTLGIFRDINNAMVEAKIKQRLAFLNAKNFAEADRIRDKLAAEGIQLMDYKDAETGERRTKWEVKR